MDGLSELGSGTVYVEKFPWNDSNWENNYFKYLKRPDPGLSDYEMIKEKSKYAKNVSFTISKGDKTIKHQSSSVSGVTVMGSTFEFQEIQQLEIAKGRHFTLSEHNSGSNKVILGSVAAKQLFQNLEPVGKQVKLFGQNYRVIGVLKKEGESMFNIMNFDDIAWICLNNARRFLNISDGTGISESLAVKSKAGVSADEIKGELTGILRSHRRLKPKDQDNFSLMEMSSIDQALDGFFFQLNLAGIFIGIFALFVGMFSVANIMFVSVKERTNIIGIKKALGAKKLVILLEFLIEAIVLCVLGGVVGLLLSYGVTNLISMLADFDMVLSFRNMVGGLTISILVGLIAGILPAYFASKLDPVVAIRQ